MKPKTRAAIWRAIRNPAEDTRYLNRPWASMLEGPNGWWGLRFHDSFADAIATTARDVKELNA